MTANIIHLADWRPRPQRALITPMPGDRPAVLQSIARLAKIEAAAEDVHNILAAALLRMKVHDMRDCGPGHYPDDPKL